MDEGEFIPYKDISELRREVEGIKGKRDIPTKELYDAVQRLAQTMTDMLEVFGAAAEQMKLEEREYEASAKKHEAIISKLDKIVDQNKTIAEGMVAIVEMVKKKIVYAKEKEEEKPKEREELFKPKPEPMPFMKPEWQPRPEPMMPRAQPQMITMPSPPMPQMAPPITVPEPELGMPPMEPTPSFDFPEEPFPLEEEPRKKGLFGMFKK